MILHTMLNPSKKQKKLHCVHLYMQSFKRVNTSYILQLWFFIGQLHHYCSHKFSLGYDIFERGPLKDSVGAVGASGAESSLPLRQGCFYLLVFVPISCALLQLLAWSRFTLHGRRLRGIKAMRQGAQHLIDVKAI